MNRRTVLTGIAAGLVAAGCAGSAPPAATAGPDVAPFAFGPAPARYRTISVRNNVTSALGQPTTINSRLEFTSRVAVTTAPGGRNVEILIDSVIRVEGQMLLAGSRQRASGATLRGRITAAGQLTDLELNPVDLASDPIVGQISGGLQQYFPRVPVGGVVPGMTWSDSTTVTRDQNSAQIVLDAVTEYRAGAWTDTTGQAELEVEWTRDYTVSGSGEQMGQAFTVSGAGRSQGHHRFRADGSYLGSTVRDSSSSDINVTALGLTVPLAQTGVDSVTILP